MSFKIFHRYLPVLKNFLTESNQKTFKNQGQKIKLEKCNRNGHMNYSTSDDGFPQLDPVIYDKICTEALESFSEYFEELIERGEHLANPDVSYGDGVLTVKFGQPYGTYVINRQTPNKQIWLSSPTSGPKRYDFRGDSQGMDGEWIYKHTGESMHTLLQREIKEIMRNDVDFFSLPYGRRKL